MQVSVETTEGLERKLTVEIPADQIDGEVKKRVADTAKKIRLDGFRPGKVPAKVVKQRFGDSLRAEVIGEMASQSFQQAVTQESLRPVGQPRIEETQNTEGQALQFTATFEVYPEIELADPAELKLERLAAEISADDIEAMIGKLRDQQSSWTEVERAAAEGDQLNIDYTGTRDGEAFDGGSAEGSDLELGSKRMIEGFEAGLVGAEAGQQHTLNLTFPEDYHAEELKGAAVTFEVTVNRVSEKTLPALDDEFFAKFDVSEGGLDAFKEKVQENMQRQLKDVAENHLKQQIMDGLVEQNAIDLPAAMIAEEIKGLRQQSLAQFGGAAENFDLSLLPDELFEEQARKRVALGVILSRVVEKYEIEPDRERLVAFVDEIASSYEDPEEVRNHYLGDESRLQQVQMMVMESMVVEKISDVAQLSEKSCSYDEALAAAQADG